MTDDAPATACPLGRGNLLTALEERERRVTFARMKTRPFGFDPDGKPYAQVSGVLVRTAVEALRASVAERTRREAPPDADVPTLVAAAEAQAVETLVARLNEAIGDPAYFVTEAYLLDEGNRYSRELELFVNVYAQEISGDRRFYWKRGAAGIPPALVTVMRALSTRAIFEVVPRLTRRFVATDVRVVATTPSSAVLQWYSKTQREGLRTELRSDWLQMSCPAFCGAYASIPSLMRPGTAPANVEALQCQRQGSECCEWRFTWKSPEKAPVTRLVAGVVLSLALLGGAAARLPGAPALLLLAPLPAAFAFHVYRLAAKERELERQTAVLTELRDLAETLHAEKEAAQGDRQLLRITGERDRAALAAILDLSLRLSGRFERDAFLRTALESLASGSLFDRALVLLLDDERFVLSGGPCAGVGGEVAARVRQFRETLPHMDELRPFLSAKEPQVVDVETLRKTPLGAFWPTLRTRELLAMPLSLRDRALGLLLVDNSLSGRPFTDDDRKLVAGVGQLLAVGLDQLRLRAGLDREREKTWPGQKL